MVSFLFGAPEGTRTPDLLIRSQALYPAELRAHIAVSATHKIISIFCGFVNSKTKKSAKNFNKFGLWWKLPKACVSRIDFSV